MDYRSYEAVAESIRRAAPRFLRRAHAAGARSVQIEDVVSELNVAWCIARDKFDPSLGVPFLAYLSRGMQNHVNRWIDEQIGHVGFDLDADNFGESEKASMHEALADSTPTPDLVVEDQSMLDFVLSMVSPDTRRFIELLLNPPAFLFQEVDAGRERAAFARERGITTASPKGITGDLIFNLMGLERPCRNRIYGEMKMLAFYMDQEVTQ